MLLIMAAINPSSPTQSTYLQKLGRLVRYYILLSTTEAGSGHPTSSLSATDLMTVLMFGGFFRFDSAHPGNHANDRLIFSKGHASPLLYALWAAAGKITEEELKTLRVFGSRLEGHPATTFPYTEAATGSLGQGLSVGVGMALNAKYLDKIPYRTFVLLGDSEMAEGSVWEAMQCAEHYKLNNLVGILDVNRLGQRGETMHGHNLEAYQKKIAAFGWDTTIIDGHSYEEISHAYEQASAEREKPFMIIARTLKGKGVSFLENKEGWHGKALSKDDFQKAIAQLGEIDHTARGTIALASHTTDQKYLSDEFTLPPLPPHLETRFPSVAYPKDKPVATRRAYGAALVRIFPHFPRMVILDAEVGNSTYAELFKNMHPEHFFEMYIAEQNMAGVALGLARRGKIPFCSTFAAFFTRAFDQIRMSQYSDANIKFVGSHAGVSIGEDGPSQMGLEDLALFRTIHDSVVLYPADAISTEKLVEEAARHRGIVYIRTTRKDTPVLYDAAESFPIGGSKTLRASDKDAVTIVAAGITLHEALAAHEELKKQGIAIRVIDCYSIKPIDNAVLEKAARETKAIVTVEDHYPEGGLGEAAAAALSETGARIHILAVRRMPKSGKPEELLRYEEISKEAITTATIRIIASHQEVSSS